MNVSFRPLRLDAIDLLSANTGIDFSQVEFSNERDWFCCTVRDDLDHVALVIVFEFKSSCDAHVTTVMLDKRSLTRHLLETVIGTVFRRAARITALIDPANMTALRQVWRMGFVQEGYLRRGLGDHDAVLFGLIPEDCPYLTGAPFRIMRIAPTHPLHPGVN